MREVEKEKVRVTKHMLILLSFFHFYSHSDRNLIKGIGISRQFK